VLSSFQGGREQKKQQEKEEEEVVAGEFVTEWQNLLQSAQVDFKEIDVAAGVSALLAAKAILSLGNVPTLFCAGECGRKASRVSLES
jgi:nucleosome binding factor SPN SPT16 subunit